jgi:ankyrin repeat protein
MVLLKRGHSLAVQNAAITLSYCVLLLVVLVLSPGCHVAGEEGVQGLVMKSVMEDDAVELKRLLTASADDEALLVSHKYDINAKDEASGQTALMRATLVGSTNCVEILLQLGADVTISEKDGYTPMHGAGFQGRAKVAKLLIDHGVNVNDLHTDGKMPIHRAWYVLYTFIIITVH